LCDRFAGQEREQVGDVLTFSVTRGLGDLESFRAIHAALVGKEEQPVVRRGDEEVLDDVVAAHPLKGQDELVKKFMQRTGEPFMTQDPLCTYAHVWLIKEAIEQAKSADPKAIRDALASLAAAQLAVPPGTVVTVT
jgi:hypothetical protein